MFLRDNASLIAFSILFSMFFQELARNFPKMEIARGYFCCWVVMEFLLCLMLMLAHSICSGLIKLFLCNYLWKLFVSPRCEAKCPDTRIAAHIQEHSLPSLLLEALRKEMQTNAWHVFFRGSSVDSKTCPSLFRLRQLEIDLYLCDELLVLPLGLCPPVFMWFGKSTTK